MLQLKKFPDIPDYTREEARESRPHPEEPCFLLLARGEGSFPCVVGKEFPAFPSHLKWRRSPQERREELPGCATFPESPRCAVHYRESCFPCTASTFKPRFDSHHGGSWDSPVGRPRGNASRESHRSLDPRDGKLDTAVTAREVSARAYPHSRRRVTPLGRLQKYPRIHVSTGEESSGSDTESTQDLRNRHRRERNPERPPRNSFGAWPFLRPPERVPEVPVVSREHRPQLEKIQEVLPSRRDEAHFR